MNTESKIFRKYYEVPESMHIEYAEIFDTVLGILTGNPDVHEGDAFGGGIIIEDIHNENSPYMSVHLKRRGGYIQERKGWLCITTKNLPGERLEKVMEYCGRFRELSEEEYRQDERELTELYKNGKKGFLKIFRSKNSIF